METGESRERYLQRDESLREPEERHQAKHPQLEPQVQRPVVGVRKIRLGNGALSDVQLLVEIGEVVQTDTEERVVADHFERRKPQVQPEATRLAQGIEALRQDARDGQTADQNAAHQRHDSQACCQSLAAEHDPD